jgi:hypothetical protein
VLADKWTMAEAGHWVYPYFFGYTACAAYALLPSSLNTSDRQSDAEHQNKTTMKTQSADNESEPIAIHQRLTVSNLSNHEPMKITLSQAKQLEKRMGSRVWDGLLFNRDGITNPMLTVLPNSVGSEIGRILKVEDRPHCGACQLEMTPSNSTIIPEMFLCDACAKLHGYFQS